MILIASTVKYVHIKRLLLLIKTQSIFNAIIFLYLKITTYLKHLQSPTCRRLFFIKIILTLLKIHVHLMKDFFKKQLFFYIKRRLVFLDLKKQAILRKGRYAAR